MNWKKNTSLYYFKAILSFAENLLEWYLYRLEIIKKLSRNLEVKLYNLLKAAFRKY